ncbi:MAG: hypothetical protein JSR77_01690 [Planctomycetes bacterium]|nr:hypothetical protein [Planctomycetota bacterium]
MELLFAFINLNACLSGVHALRQFAESRESKERAYHEQEMRTLKSLSLQMDALIAQGKIEEADALGRECFNTPPRQPKVEESAEYLAAIGMVISRIRDSADRAQAAVSTGGGAILNKALSPGTLMKTTELSMKLDEVSSPCLMLEMALTDPMFTAIEHVVKLEALAEWFNTAFATFTAVNRQHANLPNPEDAIAQESREMLQLWLPSSWYDRATDGGLYPNLLNRARTDGRLVAKQNGKRYTYRLGDVCNLWEHYKYILISAAKKMRS